MVYKYTRKQFLEKMADCFDDAPSPLTGDEKNSYREFCRLEEMLLKKKSWKPVGDECYYSLDFLEDDLYCSVNWHDDFVDNRLWKAGLVFKNKEEAVAAAKKILKIK